MGRPRRSVGAGSPPHRRGKEWVDGLGVALGGITPAQAGKSRARRVAEAVRRDHPRTGGEKSRLFFAVVTRSGSPPRGRGKAFRQTGLLLPAGITPAWAGKSGRVSGTAACYRDHPRVGGEKSESFAITGVTLGSPPRGRGKARHLSHGLLPCG